MFTDKFKTPKLSSFRYLAPLTLLCISSAFAQTGPAGYIFCAKEKAICSFSGTRQVAYGANGQFNYKTANASIACNNATFGDPVRGVVKACYYANSQPGSSSSSQSSSSSSSLPRSSSSSSSSAGNASSVVIQEGQTGFCGVDGTVDSNNTGYTGSGFANSDNAINKSINWQVDVTGTNQATLEIRFANGGGSARPGNLVINGGSNGTYTVRQNATGGWSNWTAETVTVDLVQGPNTIKLTSTTNGGLGNIDSLTVRGVGVSAGRCGTSSSSPSSSSSSSRSSISSSSSSSSSTSYSSSSTGAPAGYIRITDTAPGWASQAGGTTGGGTDLSKAVTVTNTAELDIALKSSGIILLQPGDYDYTLARVEDDGMRPQSNTTIIGLAPGVVIHGGIQIRERSNIIIRNLKVQGEYCGNFDSCRYGVDAVLVADNSHHVWLDHLDIVDGQDGNLDIVRGADYVTSSWSQFRYTRNDKEHAFSNLIAGTDGETESRGKLKVTYMYSWWGHGVRERQPRGRYGKVHVYNNYYSTQRTDGYVWGPGVEIQMIMENNFLDVQPALEGFTHSFEKGSAAYRATGNDGTAQGMNKSLGSVFSVPYNYKLYPAGEVKNLVTNPNCGAGNNCRLSQ